MTAGFVCPGCGQRYQGAGYCPNDGSALAETDDPLLGGEVGRYRLARLLGEGGMGRVYLAVQPAIGSRVAVKILSDQCARDPELLERFFAEARAVNLVNHENIVGVLDLAQLPDGRPFIVMEFIEGHTLAAFARAGQVPLGGLVQVMSEVLSALAAAHAIGIVHRDLKPDNILITAEGHAKVLDFGIAKLAPELQQQLSPRTRTGALLGTPQYMAPEQISGSGGVEARTDLYAAGIVLYELATGRLPFAGETLFDLMRAHLEQPPRPPRALRPDLPAAFEQVILTALAKRPDQRHPSASAMALALQQAAAALPPAQWRPLSMRATSGAGPPPVPSQVPLAYRDTRPVSPSPTVDGSGRIGVIVGAIIVAAIAAGVTLFIVAHGRSGVTTVAATSPADAAASSSGTSPSTGSAAPGTSPSVGLGASPSVGSAAPGTSPSTGSAAPGTSPSVGLGASPSVGSGAPGTSPSTGSAAPGTSPAVRDSEGSDSSGAAGSAGTRRGTRRDAAHAKQIAQADPAGGTQNSGKAGSGSGAGGGSAAAPGTTPGSAAPSTTVPGATTPGGSAAPEEITRPADYTAKRFDPVAYLPKAQRLARELLPDARLTSFEFDPVFPDGHVDLTMDGRDRTYEFRSPERSAFPAGRPRNMPIDRKCRVSVEIGVRTVTARVLTSDSCDARLVRAPRCSLAAVWKLALASGVPSDVVARIGWLFDESWFFDIDLEGKGGGVSSFADRCP